MTRDAAFGFPTFASSTLTAAVATRPAGSSTSAPINLNVGPVSLTVGGGAGGVIEAGVDVAREGLRDLLGKVRRGVDGVRLV